MNRLVIFAYFEKTGELKESTKYLLRQLSDIANRIIIVVNGGLSSLSREEMGAFSGEVITRDNIGYDAGGYAEVILDYLSESEMCKYDEVVLCNDTFWGPFLPLTDIFNDMNNKKIDFWGFHLYPNDVFPFIPSYFLVFRDRIINNKYLYTFFNEIRPYLCTTDVVDIYACFETYLYDYLIQRKMTPGYYSDIGKTSFYDSPFWAIKMGLPILKKKFFSDEYFERKQFDSLLGVLKELKYPYDIIIDEVKDFLFQKGVACQNGKKAEEPTVINLQTPQISRKEILDFLKLNKRVYIYGEGIFGRRIWFLYRRYMMDFQGFIVSDNKPTKTNTIFEYKVLNLSSIPKGSAIIIGIDEKNTKEVLGSLSDHNCLLLYKNLE